MRRISNLDSRIWKKLPPGGATSFEILPLGGERGGGSFEIPDSRFEIQPK